MSVAELNQVSDDVVSEEAVSEEAVSEDAVSEDAVSEDIVSENIVSEETMPAACHKDLCRHWPSLWHEDEIFRTLPAVGANGKTVLALKKVVSLSQG